MSKQTPSVVCDPRRRIPNLPAVAAALLLGLVASCYHSSPSAARTQALNALRDEINAQYGFDENRTPRINCGPCTRFATAFRERWNARFGEKLNIACIMSPDGTECGHVALKFPDGSYFDGGNGVISEKALLQMYTGCSILEMAEFDRQQLDQLVGGIDREQYPHCPNYSDTLIGELIDKHLAKLPK